MDLVYFDGEKWGANIKGQGQASCDGKLTTMIDRLIKEFGLVVDSKHPLYFNPAVSDAWTLIVLPCNGR